MLIHTEQAVEYETQGILEETLAHEAAHTSLDGRYAASSGWQTAQQQDGTFISTYGRDFPTREDMAESFVPYLALEFRPDRIAPDVAAVIAQTIPHRLAYLKGLNLAMHPVTRTGVGLAPDASDAAGLTLVPSTPHPVRDRATLGFALPRAGATRLAVYDAMGREKALLAAGAFAEGPHRVTWDASALPAGVYLARLTSAGETRTRVLVVQR